MNKPGYAVDVCDTRGSYKPYQRTGNDFQDFSNLCLNEIRIVCMDALIEPWTNESRHGLIAEINKLIRKHASRFGIDWSAIQTVTAFVFAVVEIEGVPLDVTSTWDGRNWPEFAAKNQRNWCQYER